MSFHLADIVVTEIIFGFLHDLNDDYDQKEKDSLSRMIRDRLKDMKRVGFIEYENIKPMSGRLSLAYRLSPDILKRLTSPELLRLNNLLILYRDIAPMSSLSYRLKNSSKFNGRAFILKYNIF